MLIDPYEFANFAMTPYHIKLATPPLNRAERRAEAKRQRRQPPGIKGFLPNSEPKK